MSANTICTYRIFTLPRIIQITIAFDNLNTEGRLWNLHAVHKYFEDSDSKLVIHKRKLIYKREVGIRYDLELP